MADMTFKANLYPETSLGYSLGSSNNEWKIYGAIQGKATIGTSSDTFATALQTYFNDNKANIARNSLITYYSSAYSNGTQLFGYFLNGYDNNPYGGFFAAHYNNPKYIGIQNGTFTEQTIITDTNYSTHLDSRYVTLSTNQTITGGKTFTQPIYFETGGGTTRAILAYSSGALGYGITYKEGSPDVMTFSASGNANNLTGADLSINGLGNGILSHLGNYIPHTGNTTGTVGNSTTPTYVSSGTITAGYPYLRYINTNDATTWTADTLAATDSIAFTRANITGAYTTGHIVWFNAKTIGTPFQLVVHDSSDLYLYKRYWISADSKYSAWTKMNAGYADSAGTATTCSYPLGFSGRSANAAWGNQTGATVTSWNESNGGSIDFRRDNPSSGKLSVKVDGRFYGNEGTYPAMLMNNTNSYWGMGDPDAASNVWIRTTSAGIIPYQSGSAGSGHCGLGTSSWYFSSCYVDNDYAVHQRSSGRAYAGEWIEFSATASGLYWPNGAGGTHFYPNNGTTYGSFIMQGAKGGYCGITMGHTSAYMTVMSSGLHNGLYHESKGRWSYYYNRDNDQCAIYSSSCASGFNITLNGSTYNTSTLRAAGEVQSTSANSMRLVCGNYGVFQRNDGTNWWFMVTNSGDQYGNYNSLRPFRINIATGLAYFENKTIINSTPCSWISGQKDNNAAVNIYNATNTGSYWPWMRQTNTSSGKYFSFGTINTQFFWVGSATSRTENGYDYGMSFNVANGYLQGCSRVYGAVWNDYAEMRNVPEAQKNGWKDEDNSKTNPLAGRCVREIGDGTMSITTKRLQRGCKVISDTFGFNIGETENCKTPIAISGRVLVYIYEGREEASKYIGWPVCSGPNGTVSIMTEEEEEKYPSRIVGTISEIPNYEEWGTGKVKVNGRIWIYVK